MTGCNVYQYVMYWPLHQPIPSKASEVLLRAYKPTCWFHTCGVWPIMPSASTQLREGARLAGSTREDSRWYTAAACGCARVCDDQINGLVAAVAYTDNRHAYPLSHPKTRSTHANGK